MNTKVSELEDEVREGFNRRLRKELTRVMEAVSSKRRILVSFPDGCENDLTLNQLTIVTVYRIPVTKESEVPMISKNPEEEVYLEKIY